MPDLGSQPLKLKGSLFCKCIPGQGMLGGDITNGDGLSRIDVSFAGTGGMSIYGAPFEDENTNKPLDRAGLLLSLSDGLNLFALPLLLTPSNLSRFLITSAPTPQLIGSTHLVETPVLSDPLVSPSSSPTRPSRPTARFPTTSPSP